MMAIDPRLGYNPDQYQPSGAGYSTIEQWISGMATSYTIAFANGKTDAFPADLFANTFWQELGLNTLPMESWGATVGNANNVISPLVFQNLHAFFTKLSQNPELAQSKGLNIPQLPSGGPLLDETGRNDIFDATQADLERKAAMDRQAADQTWRSGEAEKDRQFQGAESEKDRAQQMAITNLEQAGMDRRQAEELANRMSIAQLQDAGESARNAARIAADMQMATQRDATERYGIDTNAAVAREDLAGRERIAGADRTSREGIAAADRAESGRQFDLSQAEDRRQFNTAMIKELFQMGVELAKAPVDWIAHQYFLANLSIPLGLFETTAAASLLGAVPPSGPSSIGPMIGGPGAMDGDESAAQAAGTRAQLVSYADAVRANPGQQNDPVVGSFTAAASSTQLDTQYGLAEIERLIANGRMDSSSTVAPNPVMQAAQQQATTLIGSMPPAQAGAGPVAGPGRELPPVPGGSSSAASASAASSSPSGVYTGQNSSAAGQQGQQQQNPMERLLDQIADGLGVSREQVRQLVPSSFLPQQYSQDTLANSPVMQALNGGADSMSQFRTADSAGTKFGTIQAFGQPLNIRGGQDINANLLLKNNDSSTQAIQGAVEAAGLHMPDVMRQSLKAAPVSDYAVGAFGRRRY